MLNSDNKLFRKLLIFSFIFFGLSLIVNSVIVYAATSNHHQKHRKNKIQKIRKQQREIMKKLELIEHNEKMSNKNVDKI
jgi:CHASE3 domain sensor protein